MFNRNKLPENLPEEKKTLLGRIFAVQPEFSFNRANISVTKLLEAAAGLAESLNIQKMGKNKKRKKSGESSEDTSSGLNHEMGTAKKAKRAVSNRTAAPPADSIIVRPIIEQIIKGRPIHPGGQPTATEMMSELQGINVQNYKLWSTVQTQRVVDSFCGVLFVDESNCTQEIRDSYSKLHNTVSALTEKEPAIAKALDPYYVWVDFGKDGGPNVSPIGYQKFIDEILQLRATTATTTSSDSSGGANTGGLAATNDATLELDKHSQSHSLELTGGAPRGDYKSPALVWDCGAPPRKILESYNMFGVTPPQATAAAAPTAAVEDENLDASALMRLDSMKLATAIKTRFPQVHVAYIMAPLCFKAG